MKEQWFIPFSEELNVGSGGARNVCQRLKWWENSGWWLVIVVLPYYGEFKGIRLAHCASWCHVSRPGAVGFVLDRELIPPFLLPPQAENLKGGGMFMMDGRLFFFFFFKGKHHRTPDGRDPNRDICDVMRQTGTYFSHVEMSGRGSLSGVDGTITLLSQGGIHRGAEKSRDSGADQALWSWVSCQLGSFLDKRNTDIRWKHI